MKYLRKFNEEFVSAIEAQNIEKWSKRLVNIEQGIHELRNEIESETQKYTLYELRVKIAEIDNTFLAERIKDDEVI